MLELDVRDLPVPEPIQVALSALVKLQEGEIIHFRHRMVPQLLLPRLKTYYYQMLEGDEVDIYICHADDKDSIEQIKRLIA